MHTRIIFLIDDDCDDIEFFKEAFAGMGDNFTLICAQDSTQALQKLSAMEALPVLMLLDAGMPAMNGWEFLKLIKADSRFATLPIIMASTSSRQVGIEEARNLGAVAYVVKPCDFNDLKRIVQFICAGLDGVLQEKLHELQEAMPQHVFVFSEALPELP